MKPYHDNNFVITTYAEAEKNFRDCVVSSTRSPQSNYSRSSQLMIQVKCINMNVLPDQASNISSQQLKMELSFMVKIHNNIP
jgi:hypothetical protein